jgi:hypothetical protein
MLRAAMPQEAAALRRAEAALAAARCAHKRRAAATERLRAACADAGLEAERGGGLSPTSEGRSAGECVNLTELRAAVGEARAAEVEPSLVGRAAALLAAAETAASDAAWVAWQRNWRGTAAVKDLVAASSSRKADAQGEPGSPSPGRRGSMLQAASTDLSSASEAAKSAVRMTCAGTRKGEPTAAAVLQAVESAGVQAAMQSLSRAIRQAAASGVPHSERKAAEHSTAQHSTA